MFKGIYFSFILLSTFFSTLFSDKTFGPFDLIMNSFDVCPIIKDDHCTKLNIEITGKATMYMDFKVIKSVATSKGKVTVTANGKELMRLQMNKPCHHVFLKPLLGALFNVTDNCMVLKGDYSRKVDMGQIFHNYFGGSFFYGNITFKAHIYSDQCNFSCTILHVTLSPK